MDDKPYKIAILWRGDRDGAAGRDTAEQSLSPHLRRAGGPRHRRRAGGLRRGLRRGGPRAAAEGRRRAGLGRPAQRAARPAPCSTRCCAMWRRAGPGSAPIPTRSSRWGPRRCSTAPGILAGAPTRISTAPRPSFREFPNRLRSAGPRVLKQNRGNGGQGVWKVELGVRSSEPSVRVLEARRGSMIEELPLADFMARCEAYFGGGRLHRRSAVSTAAARRHDPLLHGRRSGRRLRPPVYQGADPAAARRAGFARGAARPAHHARPRRRAIPGAAGEDGTGVDAADDAGARSPPRRCRSSGTPISSTDRAPRRARTPTSCARSMSARSSRSRIEAPAAIARLALDRLQRARTS